MINYINSLLLMNDAIWIGIAAACVVVFTVIGFIIGRAISDKMRNAKVGTVETVVAKMKEEAEPMDADHRLEYYVFDKPQAFAPTSD